MQYRSYILISIALLLLCACGKRKVCTDASALNYAGYYYPESEIMDNSLCTYGPAVKLAGNWTYTDTFTYYPPAGGAPQTSYTLHRVNMQFTGNGGSTLFITGLPFGTGGREVVFADSIVFTNVTLIVHNSNGVPQYITFPDGLTNSARAYMLKQN